MDIGASRVQAKWKYIPVTDEQIHRAIKRMKPWKATQSGTIPNAIFVHTRELLVPHLGLIFRATDTLRTYPDDWKLTETPVLKKPGKCYVPYHMSTPSPSPSV